MYLNKVMMVVAGVLVLSGTAQSLNLPSKGFIQRGFKSCTDNCKEDACKSEKDRKWCEQNCSHKIDMQKVCSSSKTIEDPNLAKVSKLTNDQTVVIDYEKLSPDEKKLIDQINNQQSAKNPDLAQASKSLGNQKVVIDYEKLSPKEKELLKKIDITKLSDLLGRKIARIPNS